MSTTTVEIQDLPTRFAEVISLASAGTEVVITENHVPKAKLIPLKPGQPRIVGLHPGSITMSPDFDDPLPDDFWTGTP